MRFKIGGRDAGNSAAKNFGDNHGRVIGTVHAKIGELVRDNALRVKRAEAGLIAEKWAAGHGHAARKQDFHAGIEPDHGNPGVAKKFGSPGLRVGAAAEGQHGWFFLFDGAAEGGAQFVGFELAEGGFAVAFEKLWNGDAGGGFDAFIEIHETPAEMLGESRADSAFAGAHKPGKADDRNARKRAASCERLVHDGDERGVDFITIR